MIHTLEFQLPIISGLLMEDWSVGTVLDNLGPGRTQFNLYNPVSGAIATLNIQVAAGDDYKAIKASFVRQLDTRGIPHR